VLLLAWVVPQVLLAPPLTALQTSPHRGCLLLLLLLELLQAHPSQPGGLDRLQQQAQLQLLPSRARHPYSANPPWALLRLL
jgi:hypothetical protein